MPNLIKEALLSRNKCSESLIHKVLLAEQANVRSVNSCWVNAFWIVDNSC